MSRLCLVVSDSADPRFIADVYNHGGQRCILKSMRMASDLAQLFAKLRMYENNKDRNRELQGTLS